jgi:hypothetical protein
LEPWLALDSAMTVGTAMWAEEVVRLMAKLGLDLADQVRPRGEVADQRDRDRDPRDRDRGCTRDPASQTHAWPPLAIRARSTEAA